MININALIVLGWRTASLLIGMTGGLDILQHSPSAYPMGKCMVSEFIGVQHILCSPESDLFA